MERVMSLPPTPTLSVVHPPLKLWITLRGERVSTTMSSLALERSPRGNRSFPYVDNSSQQYLSCLTLAGVSRNRPLLHVGLRIRTPRRPEQALPGNPSRHCRTVVRSSSVCKPTRYHASSAYNKTVHTSEPTLSVPSHTAAGSCASSDTDGHSSPVSASTAWELCSSGLVV